MATVNSSAFLADSNLEYEALTQLLPIAVLIVSINGVVFLLFAKDKRLRTPANYLLFSLAVCDFLTGLINIPLTIIVFTRVIAPPPGIIVGFFVVVLHNMVVVLVVYHIFVITAERYFSIVHPFRHRWQMTRRSILKIIVVIWLAAIVIAFLPVTWYHRFLYHQEDISTATLQIQTGHTIFCVVFVFLLPYIFIIYSQVYLHKKIRRGTLNFSMKRRRQHYLVNQKVNNIKRSLIIFGLMALVYAVCWFPWFVISLFSNLWFPLSGKADRILLRFSHVFLIVRYLTSIVNPVLYTFLKRDFLEAFKTVILRWEIQQENSQIASHRQELLLKVQLPNATPGLAMNLLQKNERYTNSLYVSAV